MYDTIKNYYDKKLYTNNDLKIFVKAKWITEIEYKQITGQDYIV